MITDKYQENDNTKMITFADCEKMIQDFKNDNKWNQGNW